MIDDDGSALQARNDTLEDGVHDAVVGERHVDALDAGNRVLRRGRHACAARLERPRLLLGAIPDGHLMTIRPHPLHHVAAEEPRSDESQV